MYMFTTRCFLEKYIHKNDQETLLIRVTTNNYFYKAIHYSDDYFHDLSFRWNRLVVDPYGFFSVDADY